MCVCERENVNGAWKVSESCSFLAREAVRAESSVLQSTIRTTLLTRHMCLHHTLSSSHPPASFISRSVSACGLAATTTNTNTTKHIYTGAAPPLCVCDAARAGAVGQRCRAAGHEQVSMWV